MPRLLLFLLCSLLFADPPKVIVSLAPYKYLTDQIAQGSVSVDVLIPQMANPHSFEPTPRQLISIGKADAFFTIGEAFERKAVQILHDSNPLLIIADMREGVPLAGSSCCGDVSHFDNHIWLSPELVKIQGRHITNVLEQLLPANHALYEERFQAFAATLDAMHQRFQTLFAASPVKAILVSHAAFGYLCRAYGVEQLAVEIDGKEPTFKQLEAIIARAKELHVCKAITQATVQNKGTLLIAQQLHIPVVPLSPYAEDWASNIEQIAATIASCPSPSTT